MELWVSMFTAFPLGILKWGFGILWVINVQVINFPAQLWGPVGHLVLRLQ